MLGYTVTLAKRINNMLRNLIYFFPCLSDASLKKKSNLNLTFLKFPIYRENHSQVVLVAMFNHRWRCNASVFKPCAPCVVLLF